MARAYERAGYDYLAFSEHDTLLSPREIQPHTRMTIVPAIEVTSCFGQTLLYLGADRELPKGELMPREIMQRVHAAGGLFIFDHPNWQPRADYATDALLDTLEGLRGMEIYTGVIERLPGQARATDRWDRLLSKGWRVYGHGTDDQHNLSDHYVAWNCVQWAQGAPVSAEGIVAALAEGRFYASTGTTITRVGASETGDRLTVASDADNVHWITRGGIIVQKTTGGDSELTLDTLAEWQAGWGHRDRPLTDALYVRAECLGHGNRMAWTQPFWIVE
jgi:hypothetical protein